MAKVYVFLFSLAVAWSAAGQGKVIWAAEVLNVSSEFGPLEYSALQALHRPNVLPNGGQNPNSWRPKRPDKAEYITVAFDTPIEAKQVAIAESENPGAVSAVYAFDEKFNEYLLFELKPGPLPVESRLLNLFFEETPYKIKAIAIELSGDLVPGHNAIDAVGISAANIPISVLIQIVKGINHELSSEPLSSNVNSKYVDHGPLISPDGKRLYFSRQFHPENTGGVDDAEDIWVSELDEETGEWQLAKNVGPPLNTEGPNFISSIAMVDGKEVFILGNKYGKKGRMYSGTSQSIYEDGVFSVPEAFDILNDYNYADKADFYLGPGGKLILISAEREETHGLRDLYVSFKKGTSWTEPKNLGGEVNTISVEAAPFLSPDFETLYFSSSGHSGYGGMDIYVSHRLDDTWVNWSVPENLGPAINTEFDDEYFSIPTGGRQMYFTRGDVNENTDIYKFEAKDFLVSDDSPLFSSVSHLVEKQPDLIVVQGSVKDFKTKKILGRTSVNILRLPDGLDLGNVDTGPNGLFEFELLKGATYALNAEKEGYVARTEVFTVPMEEGGPEEMEIQLFVETIETGVSISLNTITFELNRDLLRTSSFPELDRIVNYLLQGDIDRIEILGYADSTGDATYNQILSKKRADRVAAYFLSKGISVDRVMTVGYGEANPVASNETAEGRRQNRRVEFRILEPD